MNKKLIVIDHLLVIYTRTYVYQYQLIWLGLQMKMAFAWVFNTCGQGVISYTSHLPSYGSAVIFIDCLLFSVPLKVFHLYGDVTSN